MKTSSQIALILLFSAAFSVSSASPGHQPDANPERQQTYLEQSLTINMTRSGRYPMTTRLDKTWSDWQKRTGELPPDFALMPSMPLLPDPLTIRRDGTTITVTNADQWTEKKKWFKNQYQHWVSGTIPPAPDNLEAVILEDRMNGRTRIQLIELRFGPEQKGRMTFELLIPEDPSPRPVYMTQWNHRDWAQLAVRRGYIGCVYAGGDSKDDTEDYQALYPDYDFTRLMRRAWGASRIVDYLLTRPEVNADQIAITGHSRNGKQSLWAAAFDDRIGAVVSSSCGTGGIMPWRYSDPQYTNETLDAIVAVANTWFHPRLRYFFGREDQLPIDQNELLATIAPRPLLMTFSHMEHQSNIWAAEKCYHSARKAYEFLNKPDAISMFVRAGEHAVAARDVERHIDFLDIQFGRRDIPWDLNLFFDYDFDKWKAAHPDDATEAPNRQPVHLAEQYSTPEEFQADRARIITELDWILGDTPPGAKPLKPAPTTPTRIDWVDRIQPRPDPKRTKQINIGPYSSLGDHLPATIYLPVDDQENPRSALDGDKYPLIIYLHQYSYAHGYAFGYRPTGGRGGTNMVIERATNAGFAVMAIDMFGFGTRLKEAFHFYDRQPKWSKMGKMVLDVQACIDAAQTFDYIAPDSIFVMGDTIGGAVGLIAAAKDDRINAVAAVAAVSPWRASNERYITLHNYSHEHGFIPRLGFYLDIPEQTPVDFPEIMAAIAPRPQMIIAPTLDRHTNHAATSNALDQVSAVYKLLNAEESFRTETPLEINRLMPEMEDQILDFFKAQLPKSNPQTAD